MNWFQIFLYRLRIGFNKMISRVKSIRFTKIHFKFWLKCMWLNFCFFFKGLVALVTLGLINPEITAKASTRVAQQLANVRDFEKGKPIEEIEEDADDIQAKLDKLANGGKENASDPWRHVRDEQR